MNEIKKRIVIIGGGFGGIEIVKRINNRKFEVLLIEMNNYFAFQPLIYQVATGGLEPDSVAYPLRKSINRRKNVIYRIAEVSEIKPNEKKLQTNIGFIP